MTKKQFCKGLKKSFLWIQKKHNLCYVKSGRIEVKGLGTNNTTLIIILIWRTKRDMPKIMQYFKQLYKKDILESIKDDISSNY